MSTPDLTRLDDCGCCKAGPEEAAHHNPPGLAELRYRIGTHPDFLARTKARIYQWEVPDGDFADGRPLEALTTRAADDPAIALMDAWAVVGDVLTFYQERIANEGFLRTATERRSVLELARAIGYELDPGVAAEAYVAFTVDDAEDSPSEAPVPEGTRIQSIPASQDELPQTFETSKKLVARVAWNAMKPRLKCPQSLVVWATHFYLEGTATNLEAGDLVLFFVGGTPYTKKILKVEADTDAKRTRIDFATSLSPPGTLFYFGSPQQLDPTQAQLTLTRQNVKTWVFDKTWRESDLQAFLTMHEWEADDVVAYVDELRAETFKGELLALREKVGFFGHNAPRWESLPAGQRYGEATWDGTSWVSVAATYPSSRNWDQAGGWEIWKDSMTGSDYAGATDVYLARRVKGLAKKSWAVFATSGGSRAAYQIDDVSEASLAGFGISAEVHGLDLNLPWGKYSGFKVRTTTAHVKSEALEVAALPITVDLQKGDKEIILGEMVLGLEKGQAVVLSGEEVGTDGYKRSEVLTLKEIVHRRGYTRLTFKDGLTWDYQRDTVTLNANLVAANHGETVKDEVLGSGDGAKTNQRFELKKSPLTHVSVATASGSESTLTVRVDGVEWEEKSSLYGLDPASKSYTVRIDDDAKASVVFGDGKSGARLPTGQENVRATYRSGIGLDGEVGAKSLTLLKTRPFGIRSVTNPLAASGADDAEKLADARDNAPLTVLTLDRIVSLRDYEDFARAYPGIGKAQAVTLWDGKAERVHVTVADADGDEVVSPLYGRLLGAIESARDPLREVRLASFQPLVFYVTAEVLIDSAYLWEDVEEEIEAALLEAFAFEERAFGQPVTAAEVMQVVHGVDGVVAIDLNELYKTTPSAGPTGSLYNAVLDAHPARYCKVQKKVLPADLLLIHPFGINLTEMTS